MQRFLILAACLFGSVLLAGGAASVTAQSVPATFGDGTYIVGTNIQPGTYRASGGSGCYWERESGFSGSLDDIIANDFASGPAVVTIAPGDAGFQSDGCGTWTSSLAPITTSLTAPFGDGTYIVGTDIAAGTWQAPGGDACYWQRLSSFSGSLDAIIANDNPSGPVVVTIAPNDLGFSSDGCGVWSPVP